MTKIELMKHISELPQGVPCGAEGHQCKDGTCPESVNSHCGFSSGRVSRKVAASNEYHMLVMQEEQSSKPKKVWRFKTAAECEDGVRPDVWAEGMDSMLGMTLPDRLQDRKQTDNISGEDLGGWAFVPDDAIFDYPIES